MTIYDSFFKTQLQVIYQLFMFDKARDNDQFYIELGYDLWKRVLVTL
ncbi:MULTISPECIES: hypothetical protein [unclassified Bartonella]|nr:MULTISPECIES: hypothetical protein [unclassified Bartonella]